MHARWAFARRFGCPATRAPTARTVTSTASPASCGRAWCCSRPSAEETGPDAEITRANRAALEGATDAFGRAIEIIEVQEAPWGATDPLGEWGASNSYVNYFIANGGVVMPAFGMAGPDRAAYEAVVAAHPDRVVVQVPIPNLRTGGGGIHCITQQQPA